MAVHIQQLGNSAEQKVEPLGAARRGGSSGGSAEEDMGTGVTPINSSRRIYFSRVVIQLGTRVRSAQ